jgi:AcrR family transcriptional regulator
MSPERRTGAGRPARISRDDVAEAALAIGLDQVTLAAVGKHLGVDHSSLYRHVAGRDDLLLAAADRAIATLDWERQTEDWRVYLESTAEAVWALYVRHPGLADTIRSMTVTPPAGILAFSKACRRLEGFGFTATQAVVILDSVMDMTGDSSSGWRRMTMRTESGDTLGDSIRRSWETQMALHPISTAHVALMSAVIAGDPEDWWRRKLGLILDGAAAMLARRGHPGEADQDMICR